MSLPRSNAFLLISSVTCGRRVRRAAVALLLLASASTALAQNAPKSVDANQMKLAEGFRAERIYEVPREQGSWVCLTTDPQGRLIASDQYGKLYRITTGADSTTPPQVEAIPVEIGHAQGLLCAFDSLYVMSHGANGKPAGLYRVEDTNGDDQYDSVRLLRAIRGGGEHGPHAIILAPDGKSLYVCAGNHTDLPEVDRSRVTAVWGEDQVIPRLPDARGHAVGRMAPGGWICRTDPEGKSFELISSGYRNEYDIAFDPNGELFTYDADMEWDVGLPWYRPTRVCHATSGSEFGWRHGTGKWPVWFPDSLPPVLDIGPGSPTGICFGTGANFPPQYQNALFISDWSYGIIYAVHLEPNGASYSATAELFCTAPAMPVTDCVINRADGAFYFLIGGRRVQSALYRVTYVGDDDTAAAPYPSLNEAARTRRAIEALHGDPVDADSLESLVWPNLNHPDRFIRYAARTALEQCPLELWQDRAQNATDPQTILECAMAWARVGKAEHQPLVSSMLRRLDWQQLTDDQRLHLLRDWSLVLIRMGDPLDQTRQAIAQLSSHFPAQDYRVSRELARLLAGAQIPDVVAPAVELMETAPTQEDQIHYALCLHAVKNGWTTDLRRRYFEWFLRAARLQGGNSFAPYLANIRQAAIDNMSEAERAELADLLARQPETTDPYAELKARPVVRKWTVDDLLADGEPDWTQRDLENGRRVFTEAQCFKCHRMKGMGGIVGPDLTNAGRRFGTRDLLETLLDPSKEVSDQYLAMVFQLANGQTVVGRVVNLSGDNYMVQEDMINPGRLRNINVNEIEDMRPARESMMPSGLLDTFTADEIYDLLAYMKSTSESALPPSSR